MNTQTNRNTGLTVSPGMICATYALGCLAMLVVIVTGLATL